MRKELQAGDRFGRLTVQVEAEPKRYYGKDGRQKSVHRQYTCRCDCGSIRTLPKGSLTSGKTSSCGCYNKEVAASRSRQLLTTHNHSYTSTYKIWDGLKQRCLNPNATMYADYGGRGIKVCDRWKDSFDNFLEDMGERPGKEYSIDRINNDGDYAPDNCRWATSKEQARNRRSSVMISWRGETKTLGEWAASISNTLGVAESTVYGRISKGWSPEKAFTTPHRLSLVD